MKIETGMRRASRIARGLSVIVALSVSCGIHASPVWGNRYGPPPLGDFLSDWVRQRATAAGGIALREDREYLEDFLRDPDSFYSNMLHSATAWYGHSSDFVAGQGAMEALRRRLGVLLTDENVMRMVAWDMGLTKALPGLQGQRPPGFVGNDAAAASLYKAGVSSAVFKKGLELFGKDQDTIAANYAVAVQIVLDKASRIPADEAAQKGFRADVAQRFLAAPTLLHVSDEDLHYLARTLQGELTGWTAGRASVYGVRELPTPLRIARVAAAYRDLRGFMWKPCDSGGSAIPGIAALDLQEADPRLCMTDALDRHVYAWYRKRFARQSLPSFPGMNPMPTRKAVGALRYARPLWMGAYESYAEDASSQSEVIEYMVATKISADERYADQVFPLVARGIMHLCEAHRP